jgi:2-methylcitrate dehydratase PrpD
MPSPLTQFYADFLTRTDFAALPAESIAVARLGFTDCSGVILAGRREPAVQRITGYVRSQGAKPIARLALGAERASTTQAGLVGGTASHALDYDDFAFSNHPSAVLVPAILAAADACNADGARMALAYVLGYEVWADLMLREPDLYYARGWHPTAVLGPLGAAAAASVVLGLNAVQARNALALAASDSGGVFENFGTMAKPWHGGRSAAAGLSAAGLARNGMEASPTALEGDHGLLRALSPQGNVDLESSPRVAEWRSATMRLNIKQYPIVAAAHRCVDAVLALLRTEKIDPEHVHEIVAEVSERHLAVMPFHLPQDALQAKFSLEFAIASALAYGAVGFDELQDAQVRNPRIQSIMKRVRIETTDAFEPGWRDAAPYDIVHFTLDKAGGRRVSTPKVRRPGGHADAPLSLEQLWEKFKACAHHGEVGEKPARELFDCMQRLDRIPAAAAIPSLDGGWAA